MGSRGGAGARQTGAVEDRMMAPVKEIERVRPVGGNESRVVELENGERGLFKPRDGENPEHRAFVSGSLAEREVAAYQLDRELGWGLVPTTVMRRVGEREGSFQRWVSGQDGADALLQRVRRGTGTLGDDRNFNPKPGAERMVNQRDLIRMKALDHIMANQDRRFFNMIVTRNGRIGAIDNGLAFPRGKQTPWNSGLIGAHMRALGVGPNASLSPSDVGSIRRVFGSPGAPITDRDVARVRGVLGNPPGGRFGIGDSNIRGAIERAREIVSANGQLSGIPNTGFADNTQVGRMKAPRMPR